MGIPMKKIILIVALSLITQVGWGEENKCEKYGFKHYWKGLIVPERYIAYYGDTVCGKKWLFWECQNCGAIRRRYDAYKILYSPPQNWWGNDKLWIDLPFIDDK